MSRLEQMRHHFLQRIYSEQQQLSLPLSRSALSCAKSIQNIPGIMKISPVSHSQLRRTPSCLQSTLGFKFGQGHGYVSTTEFDGQVRAKANLSRVKSLNSVCLEAPTLVKPKCASSKQSESTKRNLTPSGKGNEAKANSAKVNRPAARPPSSGLRTLASEEKRSTANSTRNELQCKHCDRTFAAKERLDKHVHICAKTLHKQRPLFNSAKQRLKGHSTDEQTDHRTADDAEHFKDNQPNNRATPRKNETIKKSNWKDAHRQFVEAIKIAKKYKAEATDAVNECKVFEECAPSLDDTTFKCCSYCKRTFGVNVIIKHETICGKLFRKKHFNV